MVAANKVVSR